MVDFIEREYGRKFFVGECVDDGADGFVRPLVEGFFEVKTLQGAGDGLGGAAVARELVLECFYWGCFFMALSDKRSAMIDVLTH